LDSWFGKSAERQHSLKGVPLAELNSEEKIETVILSKKSLAEFREIFPAYLDGDEFEIEKK